MQKYFWVIILTLVLLLAVVFIQRLKETPNIDSSKNQETKQDSNQPQNNQQPGSTDNILRGVLKSSNDKTKGNLMLLLADSDRIIYLHTARNYNDLIETPVIVTIDGDLTNFTLVKIESEEKD